MLCRGGGGDEMDKWKATNLDYFWLLIKQLPALVLSGGGAGGQFLKVQPLSALPSYLGFFVYTAVVSFQIGTVRTYQLLRVVPICYLNSDATARLQPPFGMQKMSLYPALQASCMVCYNVSGPMWVP